MLPFLGFLLFFGALKVNPSSFLSGITSIFIPSSLLMNTKGFTIYCTLGGEGSIVDPKGNLVLLVSAKHIVIYKLELVGHHYDQVTLYKLSYAKKKYEYSIVPK